MSFSFFHCKRFTTDKAYFNYLIENLRSIFFNKAKSFYLDNSIKKVIFSMCL